MAIKKVAGELISRVG